MNILFCGTNLPEKFEIKLKNISLAGNRYQNNIIRTFLKLGHNVENLSFISIPMEKRYINEIKEEYDNVFIKNLWNYFKFFKTIKKELKKENVVIVYNPIYFWFGIPKIAQKSSCKSVLILADYSESHSYISLFKKVYSYLQLKEIKKYDMIVGLSPNVKKFKQNFQQFICLEGMIDTEKYTDVTLTNNDKLILMYSGLLEKVTGIDLLLKAMESINNSDIELHITGQGGMCTLVQEHANQDDRIKYLGKLPYNQYLSELKNANILLNPRNMRMPENMNNFPSKIMEYLATGKVIISTKFAGYERFDNNIIFTDSSSEKIGSTINYAINNYKNLQKKFFDNNRQKAKEFDITNQVQKIIEFLPGEKEFT